MSGFFSVVSLLILVFVISFSHDKKKTVPQKLKIVRHAESKVIVDCNYTLEEAIEGSKAPNSILDDLRLVDVEYFSTDGKVHKGQILTNVKMVPKVESMFRCMKQHKFPVAHAIPVVKYNWDDDLSMKDNNTYSFCYRNISYSKHAKGLAIDINPFFNPIRWKPGFTYRKNKPEGARHDSTILGTFYDTNPVVIEFRKSGLRWGHTFSRKFDDHHFEL